MVLAQAGRALALVDADLRHPHLHHLFEAVDGLDGGLTSGHWPHRAGGCGTRAQRRQRPTLGLPAVRCLQLGVAGHKQANQIFESLRDSVDIVVLDSPPLLPVADALVLSRMADATLLVANAERTRRNELIGAFEALDHAGARLAGTILNQVAAGGNDTYYEYDPRLHD